MKPLGPCNQSRGPSLLLKPHPFYKVAQVETRLESGTPNPTVFYALPRHRRLSFGLFHPGRYCGTQLACRLPAVAGKQGLRYSFQGCAVRDFRVLHGISPPPNPVSDAFHASLNFHEVGRAAIHNNTKTVRYLLRNL